MGLKKTVNDKVCLQLRRYKKDVGMMDIGIYLIPCQLDSTFNGIISDHIFLTLLCTLLTSDVWISTIVASATMRMIVVTEILISFFRLHLYLAVNASLDVVFLLSTSIDELGTRGIIRLSRHRITA